MGKLSIRHDLVTPEKAQELLELCPFGAISYEDGKLTLTAGLDGKIVTLTATMPCLISVDGDINTPRLPSYKIRKTLTDDVVSFVTFADLPDQDPRHYGLSGSATQVERIFPPEKQTQKHTVTGDADAQAEALFALLGEKKLL